MVPPAAGGGILMVDVDAGGGAVAGAPALQPLTAALAPVVDATTEASAPAAEPNAAAAASLGPGAAAVTPRLVNGLIAITDQEPQLKPPAAKPKMHDVATMLREKLLADKLEAKTQRDALKEKEKTSRGT